MTITSTRNEKIKNLRALFRDKKMRAEQNVYVAEGLNLLKDIPSDVVVREWFVKESKMEKYAFLAEKFGIEPYTVTDSILDAVSDTVTPSGVVAVIEKPVSDGKPEGDIVLLLDGISDAGNLGTIIRTAAARNIKTIFCVDCVDAFSPKVVRAAMSGTFFVNVLPLSEDKAWDALKGYDLVALDMGGKDIFGYVRSGKIAIAVGSEAHGLRASVRERAKDVLALPMTGNVESLNAAVSASIAMYLIR